MLIHSLIKAGSIQLPACGGIKLDFVNACYMF